VLLTEAISQTAGWLIAATVGFERWPLLAMVEHAKFRRLVGPDEELRLVAEIRSARPDQFVVDGEARSDASRVASARLVFHLFDFALSGAQEDQFAEWARRTFAELGGPALLNR